MWPELIPGKTYCATRLRKPRMDDIVVFKNPKEETQYFTKKIAAVNGNTYRLESTVSWGSSSNDFGIVSRKDILGILMRSKMVFE